MQKENFLSRIIDGNLKRDYTAIVASQPGSLRQPNPLFLEEDALVDSTFSSALVTEGEGSDGTGDASSCLGSKAGYCITGDFINFQCTDNLCDDFGWEASMTSYNKTGRKDFSIYGDGVMRCVIAGDTTEEIEDPDDPQETIEVPAISSGDPGEFFAERGSPGCG